MRRAGNPLHPTCVYLCRSARGADANGTQSHGYDRDRRPVRRRRGKPRRHHYRRQLNLSAEDCRHSHQIRRGRTRSNTASCSGLVDADKLQWFPRCRPAQVFQCEIQVWYLLDPAMQLCGSYFLLASIESSSNTRERRRSYLSVLAGHWEPTRFA